MKIKFFITIISIALLSYLGNQEVDAIRLQQIVIEDVTTEDATAVSEKISKVLIELGAIEILTEDANSSGQLVINFQSSLQPYDIRNHIYRLNGNSISQVVSDGLNRLHFDVSYLRDPNGMAHSGCKGVLLKEFIQDSFRASFLNYSLLNTDYQTGISRHFEQWQKSLGFTNRSIYTTKIIGLPETRAGPTV